MSDLIQVHFAPVQQRGISNSPYAIYDQLSLSQDLFDEKHRENEALKEEMFKKTVTNQ